MVDEPGSHSKVGRTKMNNDSIIAQNHIGKRKLDVAVCGNDASQQTTIPVGHQKLITWLRAQGERVGVEATRL